MALRLRALRRVLKDTGSIYLHCDPTASHYLKLLMDAIYGHKFFLNEIIWKRTTAHGDAKRFSRVHDVILLYSVSKKFLWNKVYLPYDDNYIASTFKFKEKDGRKYAADDLTGAALSGGGYTYDWNGHTRVWFCPIQTMIRYEKQNRLHYSSTGLVYRKRYLNETEGKAPSDMWWDISPARRIERLGYPTQKPLALLERIIKASSNEGDTVLDPFCGCGTTVHAAESLGRKWIGIDISKFSTGLIRDRILHNFKYLNADDIDLRGSPGSVFEARVLARQDPFEFEKWVCGYIGAEGMFREPGEKGADGGVDGVLKFFPVREGVKVKPEYAIVQVKGGKVSPDSVKALHETVRRYEATAGVMVCFGDQLGTVENQRVKATFSDAWGSYPVIQGFSVESLLSDGQLDLPLYGYKRRGAMLGL
ncbi:MAG: DNA methyltransferase [Chloroflexi bacterium]|nr:DNA methyltransferase [Chloroflexota bacterium]